MRDYSFKKYQGGGKQNKALSGISRFSQTFGNEKAKREGISTKLRVKGRTIRSLTK